MPYSYTVPDLSNLNDEQRISLALEAVKESPLLLDGRHELSLRQAAKDFQIPRLTLTARYNGVPARKDAYEHQEAHTCGRTDSCRLDQGARPSLCPDLSNNSWRTRCSN